MNLSKLKEYNKKIEIFNNRLERRVINNNFTEEELDTFEQVNGLITESIAVFSPTNRLPSTNLPDTENLELTSEIFLKMKKTGIAYFLLLSIKNPIDFLQKITYFEQELKKVKIINNNFFNYNGVDYEIIYDDSYPSIGGCKDDCIVVNRKKISQAKEDFLITIAHEISHCVLIKNNLQDGFFRKLGILNLEELICEFVAKNCLNLFNIGEEYERS